MRDILKQLRLALASLEIDMDAKKSYIKRWDDGDKWVRKVFTRKALVNNLHNLTGEQYGMIRAKSMIMDALDQKEVKS